MKFFVYDFRQPKTSQQIIEDINQVIKATSSYDRKVDMMFFALVPALFLETVLAKVDRHLVKVGVYNHTLEDIAGENTLFQLEAAGVDMIVVGALNRRARLGETNSEVAAKQRAVLLKGIKSMLCVGGAAADDDSAEGELAEQIKTAFADTPQDAYYRAATVYQPSWIGEEAQQKLESGHLEKQVACIRTALAQTLPDAVEPLPLFLGGAMDPENMISCLKSDLFDGIFIDDRNCTPDEFIEIIYEVLS